MPADVVGILSFDNAYPLQNIETDIDYRLYDINIVDDEHATAVVRRLIPHTSPNYLGGIVSADRSFIYWENTTRPLPQ